MGGRYAEAIANPQSSPATVALAQAGSAISDAYSRFAEHQDKLSRVSTVAAPPSNIERFINLFAGNQASTAAIAQRDAVSQALSDPVVQQHMMTHPDALAAAETDPIKYSQTVQDPNFRNYMLAAAQTHANVLNGISHTDGQGTIGPKMAESPAAVTRLAVTTGASPAQAHAALEPHQYTRDEFIRANSGISMKAAQMIFGPALAHIPTPQEQLAKDYFGRLQGDYNKSTSELQALIDEDKKRTDQGQKAQNKAAIAAKTKETQQKWNALMGPQAAYVGATGKPYPIPSQPEE
jgi:hypothetical protein